jgi:hypothetical protein
MPAIHLPSGERRIVLICGDEVRSTNELASAGSAATARGISKIATSKSETIRRVRFICIASGLVPQ